MVIWEFLALVVFLAIGFLTLAFWPVAWRLRAVLWTEGLLWVLVAFLYLPLMQNSCRYRVDDTSIEYSCGVILIKTHRVRKSAVMHVTLLKDPVSCLLGFCSLRVSAMGGQMLIPALPLEEAGRFAAMFAPKGDAPSVEGGEG